MTYLTRCRRAALQHLRTVRPTVADRRLENLKRLMQIGRSSSKYPPAKPDFALRRAAKPQAVLRPLLRLSGLRVFTASNGREGLPLPSVHRRQNLTQEFARSGRQAVTFSCSPGGLTGGCAPTQGAERRIKHGISQHA